MPFCKYIKLLNIGNKVEVIIMCAVKVRVAVKCIDIVSKGKSYSYC